jgi:gas vesicle protein
MSDHTPDCPSHFSWMLYFLAGGVAGASVALLLAPRSGQATRDMMRRTLSEAADSARELKDQVIRQGQDIRDEAALRLGEAASALAGKGHATTSA